MTEATAPQSNIIKTSQQREHSSTTIQTTSLHQSTSKTPNKINTSKQRAKEMQSKDKITG